MWRVACKLTAYEGSAVVVRASLPLEALAVAIREIRGRRHLSQESVADAAGLNRKTVGSIERRESIPSFTAVTSIADALGVSLSELVRVYEERLRELQ